MSLNYLWMRYLRNLPQLMLPWTVRRYKHLSYLKHFCMKPSLRKQRLRNHRQPLLLHRLNRPGSFTASVSEKNSLDWLYAAKIKENFVSTHTPAVFSHQKQAQYEDALFRLILWWYTRLLTFTAIREKTKRAFEHEIESRARNIGAYSAKSRATYYFYRLTPRLCFCTKQTCAAFKNHVKCLLHAGHA